MWVNNRVRVLSAALLALTVGLCFTANKQIAPLGDADAVVRGDLPGAVLVVSAEKERIRIGEEAEPPTLLAVEYKTMFGAEMNVDAEKGTMLPTAWT